MVLRNAGEVGVTVGPVEQGTVHGQMKITLGAPPSTCIYTEEPLTPPLPGHYVHYVALFYVRGKDRNYVDEEGVLVSCEQRPTSHIKASQ